MPEASPRTSSQAVRAHRLFYSALGGILAFLVYGIFTAETDDVLHIYEGTIIIGLAVLPGLLWTRRHSSQLPIFEAFMCTFINAYAIPLMGGHAQLKNYSVETITESGALVILFQAMALAGYYLLNVRVQRGPFWTEEIIPDKIGRYIGYGMILNTIYTILSTFYLALPGDISSILRAVFFGIGVICTFIQCYRWGHGLIERGEKLYFVVNLVFQCAVMASTLFMTYPISLLVLGLLGYVAGGRRIPIVTCAVVLALIAIFHNGKAEMRAKYWESARTKNVRLNFTELPGFFMEWFTEGLKPKTEEQKNVGGRLIDRTSLIQMLCLVVEATPARQPFLDGLTYSYIPGQLVPRFFWPGKPLGTIATSNLSIYYGLQDLDATTKTTIAFGMIVEAYANFGLFGVAIVGCLVGTFLRAVYCWTAHSPLFSYAGIFTIILLAWSFQIEAVMCVWISSLFQATITALGLPFILRSFFR